MKNGEFRTIGMNELTAPLYDLGVAQFAELLPATGKDLYSWPEYQSRSILLVGTDYYLIFDETGTNWRAAHRFPGSPGKDLNIPKLLSYLKKHVMTIGLWQKLLLPEASIGMRLVRCLRWFRIKREKWFRCVEN